MVPLEERVASLEARTEERGEMLDMIRESFVNFESQIDAQFGRVDTRFDQIDARLDRIDDRLDRMDGRFDKLEERFDRRFLWIVGLQISTLATVVAALIARR